MVLGWRSRGTYNWLRMCTGGGRYLAGERHEMTAQVDRAAVTVLQQSLVPSTLPIVEGLEMSGRYVPGRGIVGGDWYDVFALPSGQLLLAGQ